MQKTNIIFLIVIEAKTKILLRTRNISFDPEALRIPQKRKVKKCAKLPFKLSPAFFRVQLGHARKAKRARQLRGRTSLMKFPRENARYAP